MTCAILCLLCCLATAAPSRPEPSPPGQPHPWRAMRFGSLHQAIVETSLAQTLRTLRSEGDSLCGIAPSAPVSWECIRTVLERWATTEERLFVEGSVRPRETHEGVLALQMRHQGRLWSFWRDVAVLKTTADRLGGEGLFTYEFREVLRSMERAFGEALTALDRSE